jgi:hypothetical protein
VRTAVAHVALVVALGAAPAAGAAPASPEARRRAEDAFVVGRLDDLEASVGAGTTPADRELLAVRDLFWRPARAGFGVPDDDGSLSARRIAWLAGHAARWGGAGAATAEPPYPLPVAGETDPYPRVTALVLDRLRRESEGAEGFPAASPLAGLGDANLDGFLAWYGRRGWQGASAQDLSGEDRAAQEQLDARFHALAARNRWLAWAALAAFLGAAAAVLRGLRPRPSVESLSSPTDTLQ